MRKSGLTVRIIIGLPVGLYLGADAAFLGEIGKIVIQAIKLAAAPLLVFTIIGAVLTTEINAKDGARALGRQRAQRHDGLDPDRPLRRPALHLTTQQRGLTPSCCVVTSWPACSP